MVIADIRATAIYEEALRTLRTSNKSVADWDGGSGGAIPLR